MSPILEVYKVTTDRGQVCTLSLGRNSFKLGDEVVAGLDFTPGSVPCTQLCASLQTIEEISEECRLGLGRDDAEGPVTSIAKHHIVTLCVNKTQVSSPIPLRVLAQHPTASFARFDSPFRSQPRPHSSPTLVVPLLAIQYPGTWVAVHLKWRLHFEFVTTDCEALKSGEAEEGGTWEAPREVETETLVWDLPLKVFPSNPLLACLGSTNPACPPTEPTQPPAHL